MERYVMVATDAEGREVGRRVTYAADRVQADEKAKKWEKWLLEVVGVHAVATARKEG